MSSSASFASSVIDRPRFALGSGNADHGHMHWSPRKSLWLLCMNIGTVVGLTFFLSLETAALFVVTTGVVICFGHSLGMHRRLIHNSFDCPRWVEYVMVYLGTLVGLGGPMTMIYTHDLRDWAQRKKNCHPFFSHQSNMWRDAWWQIHCDITLEDPPLLEIENRVSEDRFFRFLEKTAKWQQIPWAVVFYALGGWGWVLFGVCARITASVTGHWLVGYFAHRQGQQEWIVSTSGVQGYNVPFAGVITCGESWHNNHHAFPGSAKIGLYRGQADIGWYALCVLEKMRLAWNLRLPENLPERPELIRAASAPVTPMAAADEPFQLPQGGFQLNTENGVSHNVHQT
ncbi:MAG: acyl-CoA desaturase [Alphaproteobacteria bacterium]